MTEVHKEISTDEKRDGMKRGILLFLMLGMGIILMAGCGGFQGSSQQTENPIKIGFVLDCPQLKGEPFQSAIWDGIEKFAKKNQGETYYLESRTEADYLPNLDRIAEQGRHLVYGAGFQMADSVLEAAKLNPDVNYVLMDYMFADEQQLENVTGVEFSSEISAFLVGYIAAHVTETGKIGFIGGISSEPLDRFEYGYRYGAAYASEEMDKKIEVQADYTGSFQEELLGEQMAAKMYTDGCDVIFQAAGKSGLGVFTAAVKKDGWVIGVDVDQYEEAPGYVLTSALKRVDLIAERVAEKYASKEEIGGKNFLYGLEENAVGLPEENPNLEEYFPGLYEQTIALEDKIRSGEIVVPTDKDTFDAVTKGE